MPDLTAIIEKEIDRLEKIDKKNLPDKEVEELNERYDQLVAMHNWIVENVGISIQLGANNELDELEHLRGIKKQINKLKNEIARAENAWIEAKGDVKDAKTYHDAKLKELVDYIGNQCRNEPTLFDIAADEDEFPISKECEACGKDLPDSEIGVYEICEECNAVYGKPRVPNLQADTEHANDEYDEYIEAKKMEQAKASACIRCSNKTEAGKYLCPECLTKTIPGEGYCINCGSDKIDNKTFCDKCD